jgi:hypothetical protein
MKRTSQRTRSFALAIIIGSIPFAAGCTSSAEGGGDATTLADTLTRRQKDSIVSTLPVPGARAVGRALKASDLAAERALAHDTLF